MAQSILIFDFGTDEAAAQQARHKLEGWKQAFRLGNKVALKFEREETENSTTEGSAEEPVSKAPPSKSAGGKKKSSASASRAAEKTAKSEGAEPSAHIQVLVKLDFSDHEKLSHQRWLDRIPAEEPFKSAKLEIVHHSDAAFAKAADRFDSLD